MEERFLFFDDRNTCPASEERNLPTLSAEEQRELDEELAAMFDEFCRQHGLEDEPETPSD